MNEKLNVIAAPIKPEKELVDAQIVIEVNLGGWYRRKSAEDHANRLDAEAADILDFLRDHRSMDIHDVFVQKIHEYTCPLCGHDYGQHEPPEMYCCDEATP